MYENQPMVLYPSFLQVKKAVPSILRSWSFEDTKIFIYIQFFNIFCVWKAEARAVWMRLLIHWEGLWVDRLLHCTTVTWGCNSFPLSPLPCLPTFAELQRQHMLPYIFFPSILCLLWLLYCNHLVGDTLIPIWKEP